MHLLPRFAPAVLLVLTATPLAAQDDIVSNLVVNGTFDTDLSGWIEEQTTNLTSNWHDSDRNDAADSGSFHGEVKVQSSGAVGWQCLTVEPGATYEMGFSLERLDNGLDFEAGIFLIDLTGQSCPTGFPGPLPQDGFASLRHVGHALAWTDYKGNLAIPLGVDHVALALFVNKRSDSVAVESANFDEVFFGKQRPDASVSLQLQRTEVRPLETVRIDLVLDSLGTNRVDSLEATIDHGSRLSLIGASCDAGSVIDVSQGGRHFFRWFGIPGGVTFPLSCTIDARAERAPGTVALVATATCASCDRNPADNTSSADLEILARPDLNADLVLPSFPEASRDLEIVAEVANVGSAGSLASLAIEFSLPIESGDSTCALEQFDSTRLETTSAIEHGTSLSCTVTVRLPDEQEQGDLTVTLFAADSGDYDTSNNLDQESTTLVRLLVNRTVDGFDADPGDGICEMTPGGGDCTIRAAVMEANALPVPPTGGGRVVEIPASPFTYQLTRTSGDDPQLKGGLYLKRRMRLVGAPGGGGSRPAIVGAFPAGSEDRLLRVGSGSAHVVLENLILAGQGAAPPTSDGTDGHGGLIYHGAGEMVLRDVTLLDGVTEGSGGAIFSAAGTNGNLTLERVRILRGSAPDGGGGGVFFAPGDDALAFLTVEDSELAGNEAFLGAGLFAAGNLALTSLERTTLHDNHAAFFGGGGYLSGVLAAVLANSTLSGNTAGHAGGGLYAEHSSNDGETSVSINSSTLAYNEAAPGNDDAGQGGGLYQGPNTTITVYNSILAHNEAQVRRGPGIVTFPHGGACHGTIESAGYNTVSGVTFDQLCFMALEDGDHATYPALAPLADNGGATPTHALTAPGNEVDAGDPACSTRPGGPSLTQDQRGMARPADGDDDGDERCDKGALELGAASGALFSDGFESGDLSAWNGG